MSTINKPYSPFNQDDPRTTALSEADVKKLRDAGWLPTCATCDDSQKMDYDLGRPSWTNRDVKGAPNEIARGVPCPDCVPCVQCANPGHDGVCTCRKYPGKWLKVCTHLETMVQDTCRSCGYTEQDGR